MPGRYLLDSTIVVALFRKDPLVEARLAQAEETLVSVITVGELYFSAAKSQRRAENEAQVAEFAAATQLLGCEEATSRIYGSAKAALRRRGRPIPENDIWIAATALGHGLTLANRDEHFKEVEGLPQEAW